MKLAAAFAVLLLASQLAAARSLKAEGGDSDSWLDRPVENSKPLIGILVQVRTLGGRAPSRAPLLAHAAPPPPPWGRPRAQRRPPGYCHCLAAPAPLLGLCWAAACWLPARCCRLSGLALADSTVQNLNTRCAPAPVSPSPLSAGLPLLPCEFRLPLHHMPYLSASI